MFTWLVKIILGNGDLHRHQWEVIEKIELTKVSDMSNKTRMGYIYVQKCTKCGDLQHYEVLP